MTYEVKKAFNYSVDGITSIKAEVGSNPEVPEHLVPALVEEGYLVEGGAKPAIEQPENKMIDSSGENKDQLLTETRQAYKDKFGKAPYHGWSIEELQAKMDEADEEEQSE